MGPVTTTAILALVTALGVSATDPWLIRRTLQTRQFETQESIPDQCKDTCATAWKQREACIAGDDACLEICTTDNVEGLRTCVQCLVDSDPQAPKDFVDNTVQTVEQLCAGSGSAVNLPSDAAGASSSASASATTTSGGSSTTPSGSGSSGAPANSSGAADTLMVLPSMKGFAGVAVAMTGIIVGAATTL